MIPRVIANIAFVIVFVVIIYVQLTNATDRERRQQIAHTGWDHHR